MEFFDVVNTRRSIRKYKQDDIPSQIVSDVLTSASLAPSGSNRQPWKFIVVRDELKKEAIAKACNNQQFIKTAPVIIVGCGLPISSNRGGYMGDLSVLPDVSIAFTHIVLSARAHGLGTCLIGDFNNLMISEILKLPSDVKIVMLSPLGYPSEQNAFKEPTGRKSLNEIISYDSW